MNMHASTVIPLFPRTFVVEPQNLQKLTVGLKRAGVDLSDGLATSMYQHFGLLADYEKSTGRLRIKGVGNHVTTVEHIAGIRMVQKVALEGQALVWDNYSEQMTKIIAEDNRHWDAFGGVEYTGRKEGF